MIDWTHFIPGIGFIVAASDTFEMVEAGEMSAARGGAYLGTLAAAETIHAVHTAGQTGKVSAFTLAHLRRMQVAWTIASYAPHIAVASAPLALAVANIQLIESAPVEQQRGMWQMFSSGLTGTFGIGSGLNL